MHCFGTHCLCTHCFGTHCLCRYCFGTLCSFTHCFDSIVYVRIVSVRTLCKHCFGTHCSARACEFVCRCELNSERIQEKRLASSFVRPFGCLSVCLSACNRAIPTLTNFREISCFLFFTEIYRHVHILFDIAVKKRTFQPKSLTHSHLWSRAMICPLSLIQCCLWSRGWDRRKSWSSEHGTPWCVDCKPRHLRDKHKSTIYRPLRDITYDRLYICGCDMEKT